MKSLRILFIFSYLFIWLEANASQVDVLAYKDGVSYYQYFMTRKLLDNLTEKVCQVISYYPHYPPDVLVLSKEISNQKNYSIHYRRFTNGKVFHEFSEEIIKQQVDYFDDIAAAKILASLNTDVTEIKRKVSLDAADSIRKKCKYLSANVNAKVRSEVESEKYFDGNRIFVINYENGYLQAKNLEDTIAGKLFKDEVLLLLNKITEK